ncbi:hypothetical protein H4R24_004631 [Coemansia sp. RSA 988]|nr:hypothetical protein H4R24_004631 [Coemansia sp. RSA 988]
MGLREKTDFNLQFLSLVCVLVTLLVLIVSRRYTSDWRERRGFRRHLASTHRRLAHAAEDDALRNSIEVQESSHTPGSTPRREVKSSNIVSHSFGTGDAHGSSRNSIRTDQHHQPRRRRWKRFVAAMPLMPLATAYVAARIGWGIFEVLAFCSIDLARNTLTVARIAARSLAIAIQEYAVATWSRLDLQRRTANAAVVVVEGTIGWLFNTGFPAIGRLLNWIRFRTDVTTQWWVEHGGPALRDAIEVVVLEFLVPVSGSLWRTAVSTWNRGLWLARQTVEALQILTFDLIHDLRLIYDWWVFAADWLMDRRRWWFDQQLWRVLQRCVTHIHRLHRLCLIMFEHALPWCTSAISTALYRIYTQALRPFSLWAIRMGDSILLHALGLCINMSRYALVAGSACMRFYEILVRNVSALASRLTPAAQRMAILMQALLGYLQSLITYMTSICLWTVMVCSNVYIYVHCAAILPAVWYMSVAAANIWQHLQGLEPWIRITWTHAAEVGERIWPYVVVSVRLSGMWLRDASLGTLGAVQRQQQHLWQLACEHGWNVYAGLLASGGTLLPYAIQISTSSTLWLQRQILHVLWPAINRGTYDAGQAMADVYTQLVAMVDAAVAMIGDFVMEFARQNVVHRSHVAPENVSNNEHHLRASEKKDA